MQFILFFILSWWLVQFILLFILNSPGAILSFSSYCPGAIHPILQIVLVQRARNWINSVPQAAATTFAFSSVFILPLCLQPWGLVSLSLGLRHIFFFSIAFVSMAPTRNRSTVFAPRQWYGQWRKCPTLENMHYSKQSCGMWVIQMFFSMRIRIQLSKIC